MYKRIPSVPSIEVINKPLYNRIELITTMPDGNKSGTYITYEMLNDPVYMTTFLTDFIKGQYDVFQKDLPAVP